MCFDSVGMFDRDDFRCLEGDAIGGGAFCCWRELSVHCANLFWTSKKTYMACVLTCSLTSHLELIR